MPQFTTFYSYKGGVGRTLALANVAWLLANHKTEPARVLLIDFDLGAPGLHRVFNMPSPAVSSGLVDYVGQYLETAKLPDVRKFIHRTSYGNIDILPAGRMDSHYQQRYEQLNWKAIYNEAFGYEFIESLKRQIGEITPEYDYVLIDSLTGHSDVGGICVRQLPDLVVLLFRLNQQNLDGIGAVYRSFISGPGKKKAPVLPVITPSWPFVDESSEKWVRKAKDVFGHAKLLEVSFDSSLSFGEQIISETAGNLTLRSKVLDDYRRLASEIRERNLNDPLTVWDQIRKEPAFTRSRETLELHLGLIRRRPQNHGYWQHLVFLYHQYATISSRDKDNNAVRISSFIEEQCKAGNPVAFFARAGINSQGLGLSGVSDPIADLSEALKLDPTYYSARFQRAKLYHRQWDLVAALKDLNECRVMLGNKESSGRLDYELASVNLDMAEAEEALKYAESGLAAQRPEVESGLMLARALYLAGQYSASLDAVNEYLSAKSSTTLAKLLPSQILAAMGCRKEATLSIEQIALNAEDEREQTNIVEAFIAVDLRRARRELKKVPESAGTEIQKLLEGIIQILEGKNVPKSKQDLHDLVWSPFEILALVKAKVRSGKMMPEQAKAVLEHALFAYTPESKSLAISNVIRPSRS